MGPCRPPKNSGKYCFVLREAVSQTKYCCSLEVKIFGPSQSFGTITSLVSRVGIQKSASFVVEICIGLQQWFHVQEFSCDFT